MPQTVETDTDNLPSSRGLLAPNSEANKVTDTGLAPKVDGGKDVDQSVNVEDVEIQMTKKCDDLISE